MKVDFSKKEELIEKIRGIINPTDYHNDFRRKADTTFDLHLKQNRTNINLHPASVLVPLPVSYTHLTLPTMDSV